MRLKVSKSKNSYSYSIIQDYKNNGKRTTRIVETLGNLDQIKLKANGKDPEEWLKEYVDLLNKEEKENKDNIIIKLSQSTKSKFNENGDDTAEKSFKEKDNPNVLRIIKKFKLSQCG